MANQYQLAIRQIVWVRMMAGVAAGCFLGAYLGLGRARDLLFAGGAFAIAAVVFYGIYIAVLQQARVLGVSEPSGRPSFASHMRRHGVGILGRAVSAGLAFSVLGFLRVTTEDSTAAQSIGTWWLAMRALLFGVPIGGVISLGFQLLAWEAQYAPPAERPRADG